MTNNSQPKRRRGSQSGNQNARNHGRCSSVITPEEEAAIDYFKALDERAQLMIFVGLCYKFLPADVLPSIDSHSFNPAPAKSERIPLMGEFEDEFNAWARERNLDPDALLENDLRLAGRTNAP